jgi:predicted amidohydrolase
VFSELDGIDPARAHGHAEKKIGDRVNFKLSIAQIEVAQSHPEENLRKGEALIAESAKRGSDLICFPEMWTTGFNWPNNERMAREHEKIIDRVAGLAKRYGIWINGSMLALDEQGKVSNTSLLFNAKGERAGVYRKTHLFTLLHEEQHMAPGKYLTVVDTPWGLVGLSVCYDIRFPELFRTYALKGARAVLLPMAFPYPRIPHWKVLVRARAIENQLFMIGVNQVGSEDFGPDGSVTYFGDSCIIDPWGDTVVEAGETNEELLTATIDMDKAEEIRRKMTVLSDRRPDLYQPG